MGSLMGGGRIRRLLVPSLIRAACRGLVAGVVAVVALGWGPAMVALASSCSPGAGQGCVNEPTPDIFAGGAGYEFSNLFSVSSSGSPQILVLYYYYRSGDPLPSRWRVWDMTGGNTLLYSWTDPNSGWSPAMNTSEGSGWRSLDLRTGGRSPVSITPGHTIAITYVPDASAGVQERSSTTPSPTSGITWIGARYGGYSVGSPPTSDGGSNHAVDALVQITDPATATPTSTSTTTPTPTNTPTPVLTNTATVTNTPTITPTASPAPYCYPGNSNAANMLVYDYEHDFQLGGHATTIDPCLFQHEVSIFGGSIEWSGSYSGSITATNSDQYIPIVPLGTYALNFHTLALTYGAGASWATVFRLDIPGIYGHGWTANNAAGGVPQEECLAYSPAEMAYWDPSWNCSRYTLWVYGTPTATPSPVPTNTPAPFPSASAVSRDCTGKGSFQTGDPCYAIVSAPTVENLLGRASATPTAGGSGIIGWLQQLDSDLSNWLTGSTGWRAFTDALVAITTALDNMVGEMLGGFIHFVDLIDDKIPDWSDTFIGKSVDGAKQLLTSALCQTNYGHDNLEECWIDPIITSIDGVGTAITTATTGSVDAAATVVGLPPPDYFPTANAGIVGTAQAKVAPVATVVGTFQAFNSGLNEQTCTSAPGVTWSMTFFGQTVSFTMFAGSSWFMSQFWCPTGRPLIGIGMDIAVGFVVLYKGYGLLRKPG